MLFGAAKMLTLSMSQTQDFTPMTLDHAIAQLASEEATHDLPREAMRWCLDHWDEAAPCLLEILEHYADGSDRSKRAERVLFFSLYLMAEVRETRAFEPLCRLAQDGDVIYEVLGDGVTETLTEIFISVFNGNSITLKGVMDDTHADEYIRNEAFEAFAYLAATGRIERTEAETWLAGAFEHLRSSTRPGNWVWVGWASAVSLLGVEHLTPLVERAFRDRLIDPSWTDFSGFQKEMRRTLDDPTRMAGFEYDRIAPITNAIAVLSGWYAFSEQRKRDELRRRKQKLMPLGRPGGVISSSPIANPNRDVGRNDPCPCGSGKKFKKCCLR